MRMYCMCSCRQWHFQSSSEDIKVPAVEGQPDGVPHFPAFAQGLVGKKPVIESGSAFQYMSSVALQQRAGTMRGTFLARNLRTNGYFEIAVGPCRLIQTAEAEE